MGAEDAVLDCKDHLLNLEEEFLQDVIDRLAMEEYLKPKSRQENRDSGKKGNSQGFQVKGEP